MTNKILIDRELLFEAEQLLDELRGDVNPERAYAEELETEILIARDKLRAALDAPQHAVSLSEIWDGIVDRRKTQTVSEVQSTDDRKDGCLPGYIQEVPDKCDRIVWKGHYYHLPISNSPSADDQKDAERYRHIKATAGTGAVRTQLPLTRAHYWISYESAYEYPDLDAAIDAAIAAQKGS